MNREVKTNSTKYQYAHRWVYKNFGKATFCSENKLHVGKRFEWSNISGKYKHKISDWRQLCPSCHRKFDMTDELRMKLSVSHLGIGKSRRIIKQFTVKGRFIKEYLGFPMASKMSGVSRTCIANNLSGLSKTAGGFIWN